MELILKKTIETLGEEGDIVKVKPGYGRNYLLPKKLAVAANKANMAIRDQELATIKARREKQRQETDEISKKLAGITLVIEHRVGEDEKLFGSVTSAEISSKLAELGLEIDRKKIQMTEPIKTLGEFQIPVKVGYQATAEITVQVVPLESE